MKILDLVGLKGIVEKLRGYLERAKNGISKVRGAKS